MKRRMLLYFISIFAFVLASYGIIFAETEKNTGEMFFHKAIILQDMSSNPEYVKATNADFAFPASASSSLKYDVFIKKHPDLTLNSADFTAIEIEGEITDSFIQQQMEAKGYKSAPGPHLIINFKLTDPAAKKLLELTKDKVGSHLAIKINHQIFSLSNVLEPLGKEISIHLTGVTIDELKTKLSSLKKDIPVKDSASK